MTTLDRSRPFGTIFGDDAGRMFEQDGQYFRGDGSRWSDPAAPAPVADKPATPAKKAGTKPAAPVADVDAQLAAQLGGAA